MPSVQQHPLHDLTVWRLFLFGNGVGEEEAYRGVSFGLLSLFPVITPTMSTTQYDTTRFFLLLSHGAVGRGPCRFLPVLGMFLGTLRQGLGHVLMLLSLVSFFFFPTLVRVLLLFSFLFRLRRWNMRVFGGSCWLDANPMVARPRRSIACV